MKLIKILITILGIFGCLNPAWTQYFQFSQTPFSEQRINPAFPAVSDFAQISGLYRRQQAAEDLNIQSSLISATLPFIKPNGGKRWSGVGITLLDDRSGQNGLFRVQEVGASYAIRIPVSFRQSLYFGMRVAYESRDFSLNGLYTGSQYIPGRGFNSSLGSGETPDDFRQQFITLGGGLIWQATGRNDEVVAEAGMAIFDINKVDQAFFNGQTVAPATLVMHGRLHLTGPTALSLDPVGLITIGGKETLINLGGIWGYALNAKERIEVTTRYVIGNQAILGIGFETETFGIGFSYDLAFDNTPGIQNAFEVGVVFRKLRTSKDKYKEKVAREKNKKVNQNLEFDRDASSDQLPVPEPEPIRELDYAPTTIAPVEFKKAKIPDLSARARVGELMYHPYEREESRNYFYFSFNASTLNPDAVEYLEGIADLLKDNPELRLKIIGHTDDSGTDDYNMKLSETRASVVYDFLKRAGVPDNQMRYEAKGEREPLKSNDSEYGRAVNRRVELIIGLE